MSALIGVCLIVLGAFAVEGVAGFGSTILSLAFGAQLVPITVLLPALVPVNLLMSASLIVRHGAHVDRALLFRRMLPWMGLGMPVGYLTFAALGAGHGHALELAFGALVMALAISELARRRASAAPLSGVATRAILFGAGVTHGAWASGGPLVVYVASRSGLEKSAFRSTLSALWLALNCVLVVTYGLTGKYTAETARLSALLVPSWLAGLIIGERLHRHIGPERFRTLVHVLLLAGGTSLVVRTLAR